MKIIKWVNLTPHEIKIDGHDSIPTSGKVCRIESSNTEQLSVGGISVFHQNLGEISNLPHNVKSNDNNIVTTPMFIVSLPVLMNLKAKGNKRQDIFCPDTGPDSAIRDKKGQIVAVKRFLCLNPNAIECDFCKGLTPFKQIENGLCISCQEGMAEIEEWE